MKKTLLTCVCLLSALVGRAHGEQMLALTSDNRLLFFDHATPGTITATTTITGLGVGETIYGVDFRPATGELFALGSSNRLYLVNTASGAATAIGSAGAFTLSGTKFGVDFNPTVDRIRVTSNANQNIRLNPLNGALAGTDTTLAFGASDANAGATPNISGSAYTNNFSTAAATVLFGIDSSLNVLVSQNPPNNGTLNTIGALGVDTSDDIGFDISGTTGRAYASLNVGGTAGLYTIDLDTGVATLVGSIADTGTLAGATITDIAAFSATKLTNLSARGQVGNGPDVLIGGFISTGKASTKVIFRAIGPSLTTLGVAGALLDPIITLYDESGTVVATNDDWQSSPDAAAISTANLAPADIRESAILVTLPAGKYTAKVEGKAGATGVGLVEAYQIP